MISRRYITDPFIILYIFLILVHRNNNLFLSHIVQGLQNAVESLLPYAEHRNYARHIHANWKKKGHFTMMLKNMFWKAVKCTTPQEFEWIIR